MYEKDAETFEARAKELVADALRLLRSTDAAVGTPLSENSYHQLTHCAIMSFVNITKIVIFAIHHEIKEIKLNAQQGGSAKESSPPHRDKRYGSGAYRKK